VNDSISDLESERSEVEARKKDLQEQIRTVQDESSGAMQVRAAGAPPRTPLIPPLPARAAARVCASSPALRLPAPRAPCPNRPLR
jgi:hypothetical protein